MHYIEVLLKLNKQKKILFIFFLIFLLSGHFFQKYHSKTYQFKFSVFFPQGSFLIFSAKENIYQNFKESFLTELVKKDYRIKPLPNLRSSYSITTTLTGNNFENFTKKKNQIEDIFKTEKEKLIVWISNNYDISNITLRELPELEGLILNRKSMELELKWIDLEKQFIYENINLENTIKFPKQLSLQNKRNYYAIMIAVYLACLTFYISGLIIIEDIRKKIKKIKKTKQ